MTLPPRLSISGSVRYEFPLPGSGLLQVDYAWPAALDDDLPRRIIDLMRLTSASAPIIGFSGEINDTQAAAYLNDLSAQLAAGKCRLMTIMAGQGDLVGLCTLRRNLNPNNRHITDLAKGMIHEDYRGGLILPAAFLEIALQCETDGVEVVTLDVRAGTPAQRAWERFGFATYGILPDYARAQGQVHAGHFMMQRVEDLKRNALAALAARTPSSSPSSSTQSAEPQAA